VVEVGHGVVVYPPETQGGVWRAAFTENGARRFRQAASEAALAAKLGPVLERLAAGAVNAERTGADLVSHYLDPDRRPADRRWSRKHAHTQARLCHRFALPVLAALSCQDITPAHMQQVVNAAPTPGEGARTAAMVSALVTAGIDAGYLTNPRLARVHWQAGDRPLPPPKVTVAGESVLWVDPAEIPSPHDIHALGQALAAGLHGDRDELMANTAAYSGLRWGELAALTVPQADPAARVITVDRLAGQTPNAISIGRYPTYLDYGAITGARTFNVGEAWEAMAARDDSFGGVGDGSEIWIRNQQFLDQAQASASEIIATANPADLANEGSFFLRELTYLYGKDG
jgi:integrase